MRMKNALRVAGSGIFCWLFVACSGADRSVAIETPDLEAAIVTAINGLRDRMRGGQIAADLSVFSEDDGANRIAAAVGLTRRTHGGVVQCNGGPSTCRLDQADGLIVLRKTSFSGSLASVRIGVYRIGRSERQPIQWSDYRVDLVFADDAWNVTGIEEVAAS